MTPRFFWKGYLKLSLVTCPVVLIPAISEADKVRFHTLNRATGHRVVARYVDADVGRPVDDDDIVKGYETGPDKYVAVEEDELDAVALESVRTIEIDIFAQKGSIDWIWFDRPHYLAPDDPVGEEVFCVIRDAMKTTDTVGISRLSIYRREHAVMLEPRDRGIVLWTLRYGDEVRDSEPYFGDILTENGELELLALFKTLVEKRLTSWKPSLVSDPVQEHLLEIIEARMKHRPPRNPKSTPERPASNVVSIVDALRKSIATERKRH